MGAPVTVPFGGSVTGVLRGHSAENGARIPEGSVVTTSSSNPDVSMLPAIEIPAGGATEVLVSVPVLAVGATDFLVTVQTLDGATFSDTAALTVEAVVPGLARVSFDLQSP